MAAAIRSARLQPRQDLSAEPINVLNVCHLLDECVIKWWRNACTQLLDHHLKSSSHAAQRLLLIVVREGHRDGRRVADLCIRKLRFKAWDESLGTEHDRHALGGGAINWRVVLRAVASERDDRVVAHCGSALCHWRQHRVAVAEIVNDRVDLLCVGLFKGWRELELLIVAKLHLWWNGDGGGEAVLNALHCWLRLNLRARQRECV